MLDPIYRYLSATPADIDAIYAMMQRHVIVSRRLRAAGVTGVPTRIGRRGGSFSAYVSAIENITQLREEKSGNAARARRRKRRARAHFDEIKTRLPDPLKHIAERERTAISDLAFCCPSSGPKSVHKLEEMVAQLYHKAPAFRDLWKLILTSQRARISEGLPVRLPPTLIVSPPGTGKSTAARRAGELLGLHTSAIDATSSGAFALAGLEKGWGSAGPGIVTRAILSGRTRNPCIVIDEVEKAGADVTATSGRTVPGLHSTLLSLLEPATARAWRCPFAQIEFDLSDVSYLLTANGLNGIPGPLLSRLHVIKIGHLSADHLARAARLKAAEAGLPEDVQDGLDAAVRALRRRRTLSMRDVGRIVDRLKGEDNEEFFLH